MYSLDNSSYDYVESIPYASSVPYSYVISEPTSSKTLLAIAGVIGAGVLIGMALGLGLGIGAAGIISSASLVNVTNTTTG